jgi:predicted  nucleic acid-binding Zn-ribbon protein
MVEFMRAYDVSEEDINSEFRERISAGLVGVRFSSLRDIHDLSDKVAEFSSNVDEDFKDLRKQIADLPTKQDHENLGNKVEDLHTEVENLGTKIKDLRKQIADLPTKQDFQDVVSKCMLEIFQQGLDTLRPADGYVLPSYL